MAVDYMDMLVGDPIFDMDKTEIAIIEESRDTIVDIIRGNSFGVNRTPEDMSVIRDAISQVVGILKKLEIKQNQEEHK